MSVPDELRPAMRAQHGPKRDECLAEDCTNEPEWKYCSEACMWQVRRKEAREEGLCYECCTNEIRLPGTLYCEPCYENKLARHRRRTQRFEEEGKCTRCGDKHPWGGTCDYAHDLR